MEVFLRGWELSKKNSELKSWKNIAARSFWRSTMSEIRIDALLPAEKAARDEYLGVRKA